MHSLTFKEDTLRNLALGYIIIMIDNTVYTTPMLGREGASAVIEDSVSLEEWLDKRWQKHHKPGDFNDGRYEVWQKGVKVCERNIVRRQKVQDRNEARSIPKI